LHGSLIFLWPLVLGFWRFSESKNQLRSQIFLQPLVVGLWKKFRMKEPLISCLFFNPEYNNHWFLKTFRIKEPQNPDFWTFSEYK
jgi:hypothetical protein